MADEPDVSTDTISKLSPSRQIERNDGSERRWLKLLLSLSSSLPASLMRYQLADGNLFLEDRRNNNLDARSAMLFSPFGRKLFF